MARLPSEDNTPFSLPSDTPENMPIDYPDLDSEVDQQEAYDEGLEDAVDEDPYRPDDDPIKSTRRVMQPGMASEEKYTVNRSVIRHWTALRYGHPAHIIGVENGLDEGGLYIYFEDDEPEMNIESISWAEFFKIFENHKLAFLYRTRTRSGAQSRFYRFIGRQDVGRLTEARRVK